MTKKIFAMFLAVLMVVSVLPTSVFAAKECPGKGSNNHTIENCEWEVISVTAPTCGASGYTLYKCAECGDTFADSEVKATGEHTWKPAEDVAPTCGVPGSTGGKQCEVCKKIVDATPVEPVFELGVACEWSDWAPASVNCLTGGVKTRYCLGCGTEDEPWEIKKKDAHNFYYYDEAAEEMHANIVLETPATAESNGVAVLECVDCGEQKEITVFFTHDHVWQYNPLVAAKCFVDGVAAHYECLVCGRLEVDTVNGRAKVKAKDLVIPASHTWENGEAPTCVDPTAKCTVCKKEYTMNRADLHVFDLDDPWAIVAAPTCTQSGFAKLDCTVTGCPYTGYEEIPALGHVTQTFTVPATCGTYAYTFTACVRTGCDAPKLNVADAAYANAWTDRDGTKYDLSIKSQPWLGLGFPLMADDAAFNGKIKNGALELTTDSKKMVKVFVEAVAGEENAYNLYFLNEDEEKVYITIEFNGFVYSVALAEEAPALAWNWNKTLNVLTVTINGEKLCLTYGTTITAGSTEAANKCAYSYLDNANMKVVSVVVDYEAGYNKENHRISEYTLTPATCFSTGLLYRYCDNHSCPSNFNETVEIPALKHEWTDAIATEVTDAGMVIPSNGLLRVNATCTTPGYAFQKCVHCASVVRNVLPALGHDVTDPTVGVFAGNHTANGYYYYVCNRECVVKIAEFAWAGLNHTWDTKAEADAAHGHYAFALNSNNDKVYKTADGKYLKENAAGTFIFSYLDVECTQVFQYYSTNTHSILPDGNKTVLAAVESELVYGGLYSAGDCLTVGLERYYCTNPACKAQVVYVKQQTQYDSNKDGKIDENDAFAVTGKHVMPANTAYTAPNCTEKGSIATYKCERCAQIVGKKALGQLNEIAALGHDWISNPNYKPADCDKPNFENHKAICAECGVGSGDGTKVLDQRDPQWTCEAVTYTMYSCHCGDIHVINYVGEFGHTLRPLTPVFNQDKEQQKQMVIYYDENGHVLITFDYAIVESTCYAEGYQYFKCANCAFSEKVTLEKAPHVNKNEEEFTDKCTDTVTDRHCVVCHVALGHDEKGSSHNCYTADENKDKKLDCLGACLIKSECHYTTEMRPSTCTTNAHSFGICADCGTEYVSFADLGWNGHKPVEADKDADGEYIIFANYVYVENYKWVEVVVNDKGKFEAHEVIIPLAKMAEYKAPTYSEDGYFKSYCTECKKDVTQVLPKLEGLGFELTTDAKEYSFGSLIELTISANGAEELVHGFDFDVDYYSLFPVDCTAACPDDCDGEHFERDYELIYVGYEIVNDDFMFTVTNPKAAMTTNDGWFVNVVGQAANDANGKVQNIVIDGETELLKLYFRVTTDDLSYASFIFDDEFATAYAYDAEAAKDEPKYPEVECSYADTLALVREFADFNNDGVFHITDLYQAMTLLTGEQEDGKTYDVTVDVDKDGVVTVEDIMILYELYVGNYDLEDMFFMGMSAEEAALIADVLGWNEHAHNCINHACDYASDYEFIICPVCYTVQNQVS